MSSNAANMTQHPPLGEFDVEDVIKKLEPAEKVALLSGIDFWHTAPVHRLGVPSIRVSDGPNGVRGTRFFQGIPAACLPCGTGLAATWDTDLIHKGGELQGAEAKAKGAVVILGPTTNMQRSPLGGRGFESFSEDPYLAGAMTAATVNGIQSTGVAATVKHFVTNDQEHQRMSVDSIVTERALREIYLMPFQIAQRDAKPLCYMTAYNKLNGTHLSEDPRILQKVLREEWGFDGLVMSDWFGTYSAVESVQAGLDLEMPGPSYARGTQVSQAINCGKLFTKDVDDRVRAVLQLIKRTHPLGIPENAPEEAVDTPATAKLLRNIGASGIVLMKNEKNVLPFNKEKTTAVIGPNAAIAAFSGGGSASLLPYYARSPLEGVQRACKNVKYALGAPGWKSLPLLSERARTKEGKKGLDMRVYTDPPSTPDRKPFDHLYLTKSDALLVDYKHPEKPKNELYYAEIEGTVTPEETTEYEFSLSVAGTAKLFVDGKVVVDNETKQYPGDSFFGSGTREETGRIKLEKGKEYHVLVTFGTLPTMTIGSAGATAFGAGGFRIGCERVIDYDEELKRAVTLAKEVDQVVLCMGLNADWESEGYDRTNMDLPKGSDELIKAVTAVNPNTVVVVQSGTPVTMHKWLDGTNAVLQAWYGGNETGNAIADVVFGEVNPSGKLPLSFPVRNEDNPAFLNYRSERGRALYGEDIYIGYRFYEKTKKDVGFAFGHGLSYTTFELGDLNVRDGKDEISVTAKVSNTGKVPGAEVVQVYVSQKAPSINRPPKELKGFVKVHLKAGEKEKVEIKISKKYATSFWDEQANAWVSEKDEFEVLVGNSSQNVEKAGSFKVAETTYWRGL
jgi:beta-glucosidase